MMSRGLRSLIGDALRLFAWLRGSASRFEVAVTGEGVGVVGAQNLLRVGDGGFVYRDGPGQFGYGWETVQSMGGFLLVGCPRGPGILGVTCFHRESA